METVLSNPVIMEIYWQNNGINTLYFRILFIYMDCMLSFKIIKVWLYIIISEAVYSKRIITYINIYHFFSSDTIRNGRHFNKMTFSNLMIGKVVNCILGVVRYPRCSSSWNGVKRAHVSAQILDCSLGQ